MVSPANGSKIKRFYTGFPMVVLETNALHQVRCFALRESSNLKDRDFMPVELMNNICTRIRIECN